MRLGYTAGSGGEDDETEHTGSLFRGKLVGCGLLSLLLTQGR